VLPCLTRYPPPHDLHYEKVSNTRILAVPANFKIPLKLTTNMQQVEISFVNVYRIFYPLLTFTCLFLQVSLYLLPHMTLSYSLPYNHPLICYPTDHFFIPLLDASVPSHLATYVLLHSRKQF
jgi:hypothetical protein